MCGLPQYTAEEVEFVKGVQKAAGLPRGEHRHQGGDCDGQGTRTYRHRHPHGYRIPQGGEGGFRQRTKGFVYKSPIPKIIKEPVGLPAEMRHYESIAELKESFFKGAADEGFK